MPWIKVSNGPLWALVAACAAASVQWWCGIDPIEGGSSAAFAFAAQQTGTTSAQPGTGAPQPARYVLLLDAAHGGPESGARLRDQPGDQLFEKDLVLALSVRLRSMLTARGVSVVTTRESDSSLAPGARAGIANRAHAAACLLLHATTSGTGVHLYTAALAPAGTGGPGGGLRPWATAQAAFLTQSLKLSSDLSTALGHAAIPVTLGSVSLQPVDSMACPAVIVELAPLLPRRGKGGAALGDADYQTRLVDALGGALEQWRADWKAQP